MAWTKARYECATTEGKVAVEGFSNGTFGVDQRDNLRWPARKKAWAVIHIRTGYAAAFVEGAAEAAKRFADDLTSCADWQFDDFAEAPSRSAEVRPVFEKHKADRLSPYEIGSLRRAFVYPGEPAQAIEARRAETGTGSVHESAVRKDAPQTPPETNP